MSSPIIVLIIAVTGAVLLYPESRPIPPADNSFGEVLTSGNGKGNPTIMLNWAAWIITGVASCVIFNYYAHQLETQGIRAGAELMPVIFRGAAILVPIFSFVFGGIYHRSIASSHIHVGGNGIVGKGVGKYFNLGDSRLFGFRLTYNQVTSVGIAGSTIIVHASGAQYKCYVANPAEIQRVIVEQRQKRT